MFTFGSERVNHGRKKKKGTVHKSAVVLMPGMVFSRTSANVFFTYKGHCFLFDQLGGSIFQRWPLWKSWLFSNFFVLFLITGRYG